jgi:hypothetical protein
VVFFTGEIGTPESQPSLIQQATTPGQVSNIRGRQIVVEVSIGGIILQDWIEISTDHGADIQFAKATIIFTQEHGSFDDIVEIRAGSIPGNGLALRFRGLRRHANDELWPRGSQIECVGLLARATEYFNGENPTGFDGLRIQDLLNTGRPNGLATAPEIYDAVLTRANVPHNIANFQGTGRLYGVHWALFIWRAGTSGQAIIAENLGAFKTAGQTGRDYCHGFETIEAEYDPGPPPVGGFYRMVEAPDSTIYVRRMGGRPRGAIDVDPGSGLPMIFEENKNILTGRLTRGYPQGNRCLVVGMDTALPNQQALVQAHYDGMLSNNIQTDPDGAPHYDPNPPSSPLIEWSTVAEFNGVNGGYGMDCETCSKARLLEISRQIVSGTITTPEDWLVVPGQTHLVQAIAGQVVNVYGDGRPARMNTGEKVWCQHTAMSALHTSIGAPDLTFSHTYLGGGEPDTALPPPSS